MLKAVRERREADAKRQVFLNTLKGEDESPLYRRSRLLADTPLTAPPPCELAQVFRGWLSHNL